jgi:hypothetical protein
MDCRNECRLGGTWERSAYAADRRTVPQGSEGRNHRLVGGGSMVPTCLSGQDDGPTLIGWGIAPGQNFIQRTTATQADVLTVQAAPANAGRLNRLSIGIRPVALRGR